MSENNTPNLDGISPFIFPSIELTTPNQTTSTLKDSTSNFLTPSFGLFSGIDSSTPSSGSGISVAGKSSAPPAQLGIEAFTSISTNVQEESPQLFTPGITDELLNSQTPRVGPITSNSNSTPMIQTNYASKSGVGSSLEMDQQHGNQMYNPLAGYNFGQKTGPTTVVTNHQFQTPFNINSIMMPMQSMQQHIQQMPSLVGFIDPNPPLSSGTPSSPGSSGECLPSGTLLSVVKGFSIDDGVPEEPGGRDNKKPLTPHVVRVKVADLVAEHPLGANQSYIVKCVLLGYKRYEKEEISPLESITIENVTNPVEYEDFNFENLIVKHTSHSNGQKLFLRFKIEIAYEGGEKLLEELDTTYFKTVTKRAVIKRGVTKKLSEQKKTATILVGAEPKYSVTTGGQLIKLLTNNMPEKVRVQTIVVKFGEKKARRVHSARDNTIICETPEYQKAEGVPISVSLDSGATFFHTSNVKMSFVDPTDPLPDITPHSQTFVVNFAQAASNHKHDREQDVPNEPNKKKTKK